MYLQIGKTKKVALPQEGQQLVGERPGQSFGSATAFAWDFMPGAPATAKLQRRGATVD